ncbi:leucine-rich repeat-containing protein 24-like [Bacillus rossius redtenbacheri]|uniref:leucine-rich repeat-containing protein 24-like n=1 Tax=Bacillus rossius redtenbacheri TaxID=93214 RepID=UPI002FDD08F5
MAAGLCWWWLPPLVLLAAGAALSAPDWADDCPSSCRCKWSSGKKTALCQDAGFTAVPSALSSDMQVLNLSGNSIPYLTKDAFRSVGLVNLQRVSLRSAGLRDVHRDAFRDLRILVEVDLSGNHVRSLHPDTFSGNDRLRWLCLSGNPLSELRDSQFPALPHLRSLELQGCQLQLVHERAFANLAALDSLNLRGNELRRLDARAFRAVPRLKTLVLDGNPWRCDCDLRAFRAWLVPGQLYSVHLLCAEPEALRGREWQDLPPGEFACAPQVRLEGGAVFQRELGGNVTFRCVARGDPEPEVTWLFNGRPLGAPNGSNPDAAFAVDEELRPRERRTSLSVFNVTELDAGEYSCVAANPRGLASANASLVLPQVVTATTLSKAESWLLWAGLAGGGGAALLSAACALACGCCACGRRASARRKRHRRKAKLKGSVSFTDQEKKLLDVSITTTERPSGAGSCERLGSQPELELLEQSQSVPLELCDITIESHSEGDAGAYPGAVAVFPPPPEFSTSLLPAGAFGNIFISVSVNQEPGGEAQRYPDLLDIGHRGAARTSVSVAAGPDAPFFATLPRPQARAKEGPGPQYDNMGPRVTAGGSSTLSLPDDIPPPPLPPLCSPMAAEYVAL